MEIKRAVKKEEMGGGPGAGGGMGAGGGGGGGYVGGAGGPVRGGKEADWICPDQNCANKNFGWRQACNRCQVRSNLSASVLFYRHSCAGGPAVLHTSHTLSTSCSRAERLRV